VWGSNHVWYLASFALVCFQPPNPYNKKNTNRCIGPYKNVSANNLVPIKQIELGSNFNLFAQTYSKNWYLGEKKKKKKEIIKNLNIFHKYLFNWFNENMTNFVGFLKEVEKPPNCCTIFKLLTYYSEQTSIFSPNK
jgi:hypothetical protein